MKVILIEDVKSLGKKGQNGKRKQRICKKHAVSEEIRRGSNTEKYQ